MPLKLHATPAELLLCRRRGRQKDWVDRPCRCFSLTTSALQNWSI